MSKVMTIDKALEDIAELGQSAIRMQKILSDDRQSSGLRYDSAVTQDHILSLMKRYIEHIDTLRGITSDYDWTNIYRNNTKDR